MQTIPVSVRYNPNKPTAIDASFKKVPWTSGGYYLPSRPSFILDPLWHAGTYYVQEASSMFLEEAVRQSVDLKQSLKALDLCAAPGGKSTLLQSILSKESLLVCNEVIQSRVSILRENIIKWGGMNVVVTHNDPADFECLEGFFDLLVVDAPCSGSGLFRRDKAAMEEWSLGNVQLCAERQQRILSDALKTLKEEGVLIYSTCSYSQAENENVVDWLLRDGSMVSIPLALDASWGITEIITNGGGYAYRFWPHKVEGEGFFMAVFRNQSATKEKKNKSKKQFFPSVKDKTIAEAFVKSERDIEWIMQGKYITAVPAVHRDMMNYLMNELRVRYAGVEVGTVMHDEIFPEHALALATEIHPDRRMVSLNHGQALNFLRKENFEINDMPKGLQWLGYEGRGLGWIKNLGNRINNYYPKEWRIKME